MGKKACVLGQRGKTRRALELVGGVRRLACLASVVERINSVLGLVGTRTEGCGKACALGQQGLVHNRCYTGAGGRARLASRAWYTNSVPVC